MPWFYYLSKLIGVESGFEKQTTIVVMGVEKMQDLIEFAFEFLRLKTRYFAGNVVLSIAR